MNSILARVELPIDRTLGELAASIGASIGGVAFKEEESGRFDEVPAYTARHSDLEFVLFGLPEGEDGDAYVLELSAKTQLTIQEFQKTIWNL